MKLYNNLFLILAGVVIIITIGSLYLYPEWLKEPMGWVKIIIAAFVGAVTLLGAVLVLLNNWKKLRGIGIIWKGKPFNTTSPENIRNMLGRGGRVRFVNRGLVDKRVLYNSNKIFIVGQMKSGKTREAAEIIQLALDNDLVQKEQVFEPNLIFYALDQARLENALNWNFDTNQRILIFLDELPRHISEKENKKWRLLFNRLNRCPDHYILATGRSDQLKPEDMTWLKTEGFVFFELRNFNETEVDKFVISASNEFGLELTEDARQVFVKNSDGRPETTLIAMRELVNNQILVVDHTIANEITKGSLELAWKKITKELETQNLGMKYLLDSIGLFHSARISPIKKLIINYAQEIWAAKEPRRFGRKKLLENSLLKLANYNIVVLEELIYFGDYLVEGRINSDNARDMLKAFLTKSQPSWYGKFIKAINYDRQLEAWVLHELALGIEDEHSLEKITLYSAAIKKQPYFDFYNFRGLSYVYLHQDELAIEDFSQAIKLNPKDITAYINRGCSYINLHQYENGIEDFNQGIKIDPEEASTYYNRGLCYSVLHHYEKAINDFNQAIQLNHEDGLIYYNRGWCNYSLQHFEQAIGDYNKAIQLNLEDPIVYSSRGICYADLGQYQKAISDFDQFINIKPEDATIYNNRGNCYAAIQLFDQAIEDYNRAIALNPEDAPAYYNRGNSYADIQHYKQAIDDYDKAIELNFEEASIYINRGSCYSYLKQYEKGIKDFERAISLNPKDPTAYNNRAMCYTALQEFDKALVDYNIATQINPEETSTYYGIACCYALQENVSEAIKYLKQVLSRDAEKYYELIINDSDFNKIRKDDKFQKTLDAFNCGCSKRK